MGQVYGERWEVVKTLGEGGQAHAFLVKDLLGDGLFVLKRLKNPARIDRFRSEVAAIERLTHPKILKLVAHDLDAAKPYFVSEHVGQTLADTKPMELDLPSKLSLMLDVTEALAAAHQLGVVHRDVKPENVFMRAPTGPAVLGDFGLCYLEDGERHTMLEEAVGSRLFIPPELEDGRADRIEKTADVYSLGKLFYWIVVGTVFAREKHRGPQYELCALTGDDRLEHLNELLDQMVTPGPTTRLESGRAVLAKLKEAIRLMEGGFRPLNTVEQRCAWCGIGTYKLRVDGDPSKVNHFGFRAVGHTGWRIAVCDHCGHVQSFRMDLAKEQWIDGYKHS
jgi:serine/threonine protein kinase